MLRSQTKLTFGLLFVFPFKATIAILIGLNSILDDVVSCMSSCILSYSLILSKDKGHKTMCFVFMMKRAILRHLNLCSFVCV